MKNIKLPNGLEVFMLPKRDIPMVTVLIAVKNGSFAEDASNNGLAHLYEHMFFKANQVYTSQQDFIKKLDEMGVEMGPNMNAYTSTESVRYFFTIQSQYLEEGLQFMADALQGPQFLEAELEKERAVVIGEFDRYEASPQEVFYQKSVMERLFTENFVRKNVIGQRKVILGATHQQMKEIQRRYYIPNNSALFIVGDFDEQKLEAYVDSSFGNWRPGPNPFIVNPIPEHPPLAGPKKFVEQAAVQTINIVKTWHGPKLTQDETAIIALDLVSAMLGFESSPFQKELVEAGLANSASFQMWSQRFTSPIYAHIDTTPDHAQKAYEKFSELVDRIAKGGFFNERDLQLAKDSIETRTEYDREVGQQFALTLASVWTSTSSLEFYDKYIERMKKISLKDVDQALKDYVLEKPYVLGGLVPQDYSALNFPGMEPIRKLEISAPAGAAQ